MSRALTFTSPRAALRIERILAALINPMTPQQLAAKLHMSHASAKLYLAHLKLHPRRVRVASWLSEGKGRHSRVYALGSGRDAPEPPRMTQAQSRKKQQAIRNADPDKRRAFLANRRAKDWKLRRAKGIGPKAPRDPLLQAIRPQ